MKYKIAITDYTIFKPLYAEVDQLIEEGKIDCVFTSEEEAALMLKNGKVNIALLTPLSYAKITKEVDLRILPASALAAKGYSELLNLSMKQNLVSIDSILFPEKVPFLESITHLILAERYDIHPKALYSMDGISDEDVDSYVSFTNQEKGDFTIDITEDWLDSFNYPLPLAFWVVKSEIEDFDVLNVVNDLRDKENPAIEQVDENTDSTSYEARSGEIFWHWSEELESALDDTLEMLYYRNDIGDIVDAKIFGRDYDTGLENEL